MSEVAEPASTGTPPARSVARRALRWLAGITAALVILLALLVGAMRVAITHLPEYRDQIQAWVNDTSHLDVRFKRMDARWRMFGPELYVTNVQVRAPQGGPLLAKARAASIGYDMWRALLHAERLPARITLLQPEIGFVRTPDGRLELEGQAALPEHERRFTIDDLPTGLLRADDAKMTFTDQQGELRDLILTGVEVGLRRDRNDLELEGEMDLPDRMGTRLAVDGEARGDLGAPAALDWRFDVKTNDIDLRGWHEFLAGAFATPSTGRGRVRLSAAFTGSRLIGGSLQLNLADVAIPGASNGSGDTAYSNVAGDFRLEHKQGQWRLTGRDVKLATRAHNWEPARLVVAWSRADDGRTSLQADASYLRLENLAPLAVLAPEGTWRTRILALIPEGEVRALKLSYQALGKEHARYQAAARFTDLGFAPVGNLPGLRGLHGELTATDASGRVSLNSSALVFYMPGKFRGPLSADVARGQIDWQHGPDGWHIASRQFAVRNAHANAVMDLDLLLPSDASSPLLKIHSQFHDAVLTEAWHYLPIDKLSDKVLAWLDAAALAGRAPSGEFVFDGPTRNFPFRDGSGEFRISFPVEGMRLHYASGWPDFENLAADIEFRNAGLTGVVRGGELNGLKVENSRAQFVDFNTGELTIAGRAVGDVGAALGYLQRSPLIDNLGGLFADLRGTGPVSAKVNLLLPVKDMRQNKVAVSAEINDGTLALVNTEHALKQVQGVIEVNNNLVSATDLTGNYLGGPAHVDIAPESNSNRRQTDNVIRVRAQTPIVALRRAFGVPDVVAAEGTLDWRGVMRVPADSGDDDSTPRRSLLLRINTSLRGAAIGLPEPLAKAAADTRPLRVEAQWPDSSGALVRAAYGTDVRAQLSFRREDYGWVFDRGGVRFGEGDARLPMAAGLEVSGNVARLDLSEWLALHSSNTDTRVRARPVSDYLRSVDLSIGEFRVFDHRFPDVSGSLLAGERTWAVRVDGPAAHGTVLVPFDFSAEEPLIIDMTHLRLEALDSSPANDTTESQSDPTLWPNVRVSVGQLEAYGKQLGFTRAEIKRLPGGLSLQSFVAKSATHELSATGSWSNSPTGGQHGSLAAKLESTDLKQTLVDLGYGPSAAAKHALITADLTWPGAPSATLFERLNGNIKVDVQGGQLLNVQPGAGRVFGLLSITTLPRRLSLDFSDLTDKGFAFDSIHGDFSLENGDAYTQNLLLKGPAAEIGMVGRTGLARHDYDQTVVVTGSFGPSLPAAGLIAGGPAIGAAMLVFSQIFKEPLKGLARGYYRITGSWESPIVQRVEASEVKKSENALQVVEKRKEKG